MTRLSLLVIRLYRVSLGPLFGLLSSCRYTPTCSEYGSTAIERFGWRRGWWLALRRIGRCNPWGGSGYDPVPEEYPGGHVHVAAEAAAEQGATQP